MDLFSAAQSTLRQYLVLRGGQSRWTSVGPYQVHHYDMRGQGSGPPVVLVHGLGGSANGFYKLLLEIRGRFSRVLAPDLPGSGFSPAPDGGQLKLQQQVEVLTTFLEQEVGEPALLVGNSLGGALSITVSSERPDLVRGLLLVAPAGAKVPDERLEAVLAALDVRTSAQARALTRKLFAAPPLAAVLFSSVLRTMYGGPAVRALCEEARALSCLMPEVLTALTVPTLLLWGEAEKLLPSESLEYFRAHLPSHARVEVVPGFGHIPQMERPRELAQYLVQFAQGLG